MGLDGMILSIDPEDMCQVQLTSALALEKRTCKQNCNETSISLKIWQLQQLSLFLKSQVKISCYSKTTSIQCYQITKQTKYNIHVAT